MLSLSSSSSSSSSSCRTARAAALFLLMSNNALQYQSLAFAFAFAPVSLYHSAPSTKLVTSRNAFIITTRTPSVSALWVSTSPEQDEPQQSLSDSTTSTSNSISTSTDNNASTNTTTDTNNNKALLLDWGIKGAVAILALAVVLQGSMMLLTFMGTMASSAVGVVGDELVRELGTLLSFVGSLLVAIVAFLWESLKVLVPAVGKASVATYQGVVAPLVGQAVEAASPYVQQATTQLSTAAAPYVDSATMAVDSTLQQATTTINTAIDQTIVAPLQQATESVKAVTDSTIDAVLVTPVKEATDSLTQTANEIMEKIPMAF